jgi:hypothetical protein
MNILKGWVVACPYERDQKGRIEWRRALICQRNDVEHFQAYFYDYGVYHEISYKQFRRLLWTFGQIPIQAIQGSTAFYRSFMTFKSPLGPFDHFVHSKGLIMWTLVLVSKLVTTT